MKFEVIVKKIKDLKIQGAENIAKAGVRAIKLKGFSEKKLLNARPTEPMLRNALYYAKKYSIKEALAHFENSDKKTYLLVSNIIKNNSIIFTHCHSSSVVKSLIYAKNKGKKFQVYNTETRPRYQGRKTAYELSRAGIKVINFVDSAARIAINKSNLMIIGADAILKNSNVINKVGSGMFAEIAYDLKKPVYIITDSWKFSSRNVKIEERDFKEVWKNATKHVKVLNPAFEVIDKKFITSIISELGILKPKEFVKKVKRTYKWL